MFQMLFYNNLLNTAIFLTYSFSLKIYIVKEIYINFLRNVAELETRIAAIFFLPFQGPKSQIPAWYTADSDSAVQIV